MTDRTSRFGLSTLGPGDQAQADGFKYTDADRRTIDRVLEFAAELHRHTGASAGADDPEVEPTLTLYTTGGWLPAGVRVFYRYTLVDEYGFETAASPIAYIDTPNPVSDPAAPALTYADAGGVLEPGQYAYMLSAWKGASTIETKAVRSALLTVNEVTASNVIELEMPDLPAGADGFNIYRKGPGSTGYFFLASTADPTYTDDGAVDPDATRSPAKQNSTNAQNAIDVGVPGATPVVPDGYTWRIYRTFYAANWDNSYLVDITADDATPSIATSYEDVGLSTSVGSPPTSSQLVGSPPQVSLTDAAEVDGYLPPGRNLVPYVVTLVVPGAVEVGEGTIVWTCEFEQADIIHCRAYLGVDSTPNATDVIVDVNKYCIEDATPSWSTIFTTQDNRPRVLVGEQLGDEAIPDLVHLERGCMLAIDVDQDGGGATPTDSDLSVNILLLVQAGSTSTSHTWGTA